MAVYKKGSRGKVVKEIQSFLSIHDDGVFGSKTRSKVIQYQKKKRLTADGIIGPRTLNTMVQDGLELSGGKKVSQKNILSVQDVERVIQSNFNQLTAPVNKFNSSKTVFDPTKHVTVVSVRGFEINMGKDGVNDRRIYDDAHFIYSPKGLISFSANTDANGFRKGSGTGKNKGMAMLDTGVWFFGKGKHKGRLGFRQCCPFTVIRDGDPPYPHTDYHAINWHNGNVDTTSSLGCQTNRPADFDALRTYLYRELDSLDNPCMYNDWGQRVRAFPYILIDETERRKGNFIV